jgi:hypothetical protein
MFSLSGENSESFGLVISYYNCELATESRRTTVFLRPASSSTLKMEIASSSEMAAQRCTQEQNQPVTETL